MRAMVSSPAGLWTSGVAQGVSAAQGTCSRHMNTPVCPAQCKGQATGFVDSKYTDKLKVCTGKFGMFAKAKKYRGGGKFVKGSGCTGKSLAAFFLETDEESELMT